MESICATVVLQLKTLKDSVELYQVKEQRLPLNDEGLEALTQGDRPILETLPLDPWKTPFGYTAIGERFDIRSAGSDRVFFTEDDLHHTMRRSECPALAVPGSTIEPAAFMLGILTVALIARSLRSRSNGWI